MYLWIKEVNINLCSKCSGNKKEGTLVIEIGKREGPGYGERIKRDRNGVNKEKYNLVFIIDLKIIYIRNITN